MVISPEPYSVLGTVSEIMLHEKDSEMLLKSRFPILRVTSEKEPVDESSLPSSHQEGCMQKVPTLLNLSSIALVFVNEFLLKEEKRR